MEEDMKERYKRACIKKKLDPLASVLSACEAGMGALKLSGSCLSVDTCRVLARTLQGGHPFYEIDMSDCLVGDEGLTKIMNFLGQDTQLTCLILKGNAMKSQGTVALANALKRNTTLEKLSLEWNSVGVQESDMRQLCEALTVHPSLRSLDLRSNHIDHVGAAHLASVLQLNSSLQELDLRWNNIGVLGGRKLLSALKGNISLVVLRVEGNSIPADVTEAIGASISLRLTQHVMEAQHQAESKELSDQMQQMHSDAQQKVIEVLETLDSERIAFLQSSQMSRCETEDLKVHLEERDTTVARLETILLEVRDALGESLAKSEGLAADLEHFKKQALTDETGYKEKIKALVQEIDMANDKLSSTSSLAKVREKEDEAKLHSLELEVKVLQDKMAASQKHHDSAQQDLSARIADLEAKLSEKQEDHKKELAQALQSHQDQMSSVEEDQKAREAALSKKLKNSEEDRVQLEEEALVLKKKLASEKGKTSEEVDGLQQSLKLQTMKTGHLRDQVKELTARYEEATEELCSTVTRHKAERTKLEEEISNKQQHMKEKLSAYDSDRTEWNHHKKHQKDLLKELEEDKETMQKEVKQLKHSLENEKKKRLESEKEREEGVASLTRKLEQQQEVIHRFQLEEKQRMSELRSALDNYINRSPLKQ